MNICENSPFKLKKIEFGKCEVCLKHHACFFDYPPNFTLCYKGALERQKIVLEKKICSEEVLNIQIAVCSYIKGVYILVLVPQPFMSKYPGNYIHKNCTECN